MTNDWLLFWAVYT